ncbi:ABC transporter substrate-binding protein [Lacrimispora saccharolytica]|uniref:Periplasmic binding protein n=1 Tax=Lacrimispora saccharolytica (strain ATCC 35040 / DSM 2544 / NRCC 2533 / WM1) TaxID=610130 RepID=D9R264_LACSW|nr:ABC transporter substrate-binding protein [Lacrimispora saccharolytica]ADL04714.1 periplasmic binding protein [[Clostridium] saccharolyticum WM1]QRV21060.1 ABC transporter substrate-binding protein [Lacrimispora saccharolytica]
MKKTRKGLVLAAFFAAAVLANGCQKESGKEVPASPAESTASVNAETQTETEKAGETESQSDTRIFTDSAGREVTLPKEINKIAPSGPLAQIVLYTFCPDKLSGLASDFSEGAKQYIDEKYWGLPKFGQFYGKNANLNMEALIAESPDVIIDIGEAKKTVKQDMDALQEQLNMPVIFIEADLDTMSSAYEKLGELTGETDQAKKLADYCNNLMKKAETAKEQIAEKKSVYYASGDDGLHTNAEGSIHARVIEQIGAENAAKVEKVSSGGGSEVSFEQLLLWQPDIIIADSDALYQTITTDKVWAELNAVKEGKVYEIPSVPYSFMSSPPSVNRMIGIQWLGNLVYPQLYNVDIKQEVKNFYELFYHVSLDDAQLEKILR